MAIDQFALIQGARQAEADNMARARFDVEQATRQDALAQGRQDWDLKYPQAQMEAEQNMVRMAAEQKSALATMDALMLSRRAGQAGVPSGADATAQLMQQLQASGQTQGPPFDALAGQQSTNPAYQPFDALQNQSLNPAYQSFDALAGQGVAQTQQGVAQTQQPYSAAMSDLQRVQAVPTQGQVLMSQLQAPGTDPRVAAGAQAFQQSIGQTFDQYKPGGSALVDALTMRANLDGQKALAQKYFGNDRVAAAIAANTGVGTALTAPEEQQRARNIASLNLQAPGALESLGATRDLNGTYVNYNGMVFGSDADFKTYMVNRAMAGANGAIDSLATEGKAAKTNLDLNIMRNIADIMIANASVANIEFHRGVNGNYIAVPKTGATPEQVAQGSAVANKVNTDAAAAAAAAAATTPAQPPGAAAAQPGAAAGPSGYAVPFPNTPFGVLSNKSAPFIPDSWLTPTGLDTSTMRPAALNDPGTWGTFSAPLAVLTGDSVGNPFRTGGPLTAVDALPGGLPLRLAAEAAWPDADPTAAITTSNGAKTNALMNQLRVADLSANTNLNSAARANYAAQAEQLRTQIAAEQVKARAEQQAVYDFAQRLQAGARANPGSRVMFEPGRLPREVAENPYLRQLQAALQEGLAPSAPSVILK